jgi:hypothetical protein
MTVTRITTTTSQTFSYNNDGEMVVECTTQSVKSEQITYEIKQEQYQDGSVPMFIKGDTKSNLFGKDGTKSIDKDLKGGSLQGLKEAVGAVQGKLREYGIGSNLFQGSDKVDQKVAFWQGAALVVNSAIATFAKNKVVKFLGVAGNGISTGLIAIQAYRMFKDYSGESREIKIKK